MRSVRKYAALFVLPLSALLLLGITSPALADSTTDYNNKVAAAQAHLADLQQQLQTAQENLASWQNSSNAQADQINGAQTTATQAKDALAAAAADYAAKKAAYDALYAQEQIAETQVAQAVAAVNSASDAVDGTYASYQAAMAASDAAQAAVTQATNDYNTKLITNGGQANAGLVVDVYTNISRLGNPPSRSTTAYTFCKTVVLPNIDYNWGGGDIFGCGGDFVMLHYHGYISYSTSGRVYFRAQADDGFYMQINGTQIINDWSLKGCSSNTMGSFAFKASTPYAIDAWFYEWNGGACSTLQSQPSGGSWGTVPAAQFTQQATVTQTKDPALKAILDQKTALYVQAVAAEEQANQTYLAAQNQYDGCWLAYVAQGQSLSVQKNNLNNQGNAVADAEGNWQGASDDKAIADANLLDLRNQYTSVFKAIQNANDQVDSLVAAVEKAQADLQAIPLPSAQSMRINKRTNVHVLADGAFVPRGFFTPTPK
jgi:PA14 domain